MVREPVMLPNEVIYRDFSCIDSRQGLVNFHQGRGIRGNLLASPIFEPVVLALEHDSDGVHDSQPIVIPPCPTAPVAISITEPLGLVDQVAVQIPDFIGVATVSNQLDCSPKPVNPATITLS